MRNVCLALMVAAGLSLSSACSYSSSRTWGSGSTAAPAHSGRGKPAQSTSSKGKPAHHTPAPQAPAPRSPEPKDPEAKPAPDATSEAPAKDPIQAGQVNPPPPKDPVRAGREDPAPPVNPPGLSPGPVDPKVSGNLDSAHNGGAAPRGPGTLKTAPHKPKPRPLPPADIAAPK